MRHDKDARQSQESRELDDSRRLGNGMYLVVANSIRSRNGLPRDLIQAFLGMLGRAFEFLASMNRVLEVLANICLHARVPLKNRGISTKSAAMHLDDSE